MPEELWTEVCSIVQDVANKTSPNKRKNKKAGWLSEEALQIVEEQREAKKQGGEGKVTQLNAEFQRISVRDNKAFFNEQCLTIEDYVKAVYCYPAYLSSMQSASCETLDWMKCKLESSLPGEISITADMEMTPP